MNWIVFNGDIRGLGDGVIRALGIWGPEGANRISQTALAESPSRTSWAPNTDMGDVMDHHLIIGGLDFLVLD